MIVANWHYIKYYPFTRNDAGDDPLRAVSGYASLLVDPVNAAGQLGRLDLVAISLSIFGAVFAVIALAGFWMVRREAIAAAGEEARSEIERLCPQAIMAYFKGPDGREVLKSLFENHPALLYIAMQQFGTVMAGDVNAAEANRIAEVVEQGNDNGA